MLDVNSERKYQDRNFAGRYRTAYQGPVTLKALPSRIIAKREQYCIDNVLHAINPSPVSVLDVPCGTGKLGAVLSALGAKVTAADLSEAMMDQARFAYRPGTRFVPCNAENLPFADRSFDTVICLRLMHLLPPATKRTVLKELARVSSQYVVVSFGVLTPFQRFRLRMRQMIFRGKSVPHPVHPIELRSEIVGAGLRILHHQNILPVLSCECLLTLEKINA